MKLGMEEAMLKNQTCFKSKIKEDDPVTVTVTNHIIEVQYMEKRNHKQIIQKLNADEYIDLSTGEIKEFNKSENRSENYRSLRKTFKKLRYLINNNFVGGLNELMFTLTYAENMTDCKRLMADVEKFVKKLRYKYRDKSKIEYLNVVEPQGRGAWHCHMLVRFDDLEKIYIPNKELAKMWGHGYVTVKRIEDVDNIGAYLTAYLSDIPLEEYEGLENRPILIKDDKKFVKGGRLYLYPTGMKLYRKSKGIEMPERKKMRYKNIKKEIGVAVPTYFKSYEIHNQDDELINTITFEQYNLKRKLL